jgi:membrane protein
MNAPRAVLRRSLRSFYDHEMAHHAAALTYFSLLALFPLILLSVALLGLVGQFPATYDAILVYLEDVVPDSTLNAVDASLSSALQDKGTAATALVVGVIAALVGTTGVLEAARRALNVTYDAAEARGFIHRKATDIASTVLMLGLVLVTLVLVFVGGDLAANLFDVVGLGAPAAVIWGVARWPAALVVAVLLFALVYHVAPNVRHRGWRWIAPGAVVGVLLWLAASAAFSFIVSNFAAVNATYGTFTAAVVLLVWLWLTNLALLFGAEVNAEIERGQQLGEGTPATGGLRMRRRHG